MPQRTNHDFSEKDVAAVIAKCKQLFHSHPITIHESLVVALHLLFKAIDLLDPHEQAAVARNAASQLLEKYDEKPN